jgi:hypothetical protein
LTGSPHKRSSLRPADTEGPRTGSIAHAARTRLQQLKAEESIRTLLGVVAALVFVFVLPLTTLILVPDQGGHLASVVTWLLMLASGWRMAVLVHSGRRRMFEFIYSAFVYLFFGLAPTVQLRTNHLPSTTPGVRTDLLLYAALLAAAGVCSGYVGFALGYRSNRVDRTTERAPGIHLPRLRLLTAIALFFTGYYLYAIAPTSLFADRQSFGSEWYIHFPDVSTAWIVQALGTAPLLVVGHAWLQRRNIGAPAHPRRLLAVLLLAGAMLLVNPVSSARYTSGTVWGSVLAGLGVFKSRLRTSLFMVAILTGLLFVFPVLDAFRYAGTVHGARSGFFAEYAGNGDYDAFAQLVNTAEYVSSPAWVPLRQFLGPLFFWIPRGVWPEKPLDTGVLLAQFKDYSFTNLSAPIWSELLVNVSVVGLVLGSLLIGWLLGKGDRASESWNSGVPRISASILPFYLLILLRGSLLQATGTAIVLAMSLLFIRTRNPAYAVVRADEGTTSATSESPPSVS